MTTLELRYRQLLKLFPHRHRDRFLEEMVGTLMEGASPKQRFPRVPEIFDLFWNALWLRFSRGGLPRVRDARWADAAAVSGLVGSFLMFATTVLAALNPFFLNVRLPWKDFLQVGLWLLTALLALLGLRVAAAASAWLVTLAHLGYRLVYYSDNPTLLTHNWAFTVGGISVAACLSVAAPRHHGRRILGNPLTTMICGTLLLFGGSGFLDSRDSYGYYFNMPGLPTGLNSLVLTAIALAMLIWGFARSGRDLRRRLITIALPSIVMMPVMRMGYEGFEASSMRFWPTPVLLTIPQWLIMLFLPMVIFWLGTALVRRADDRDQLIELGRAELARRRDESGPEPA